MAKVLVYDYGTWENRFNGRDTYLELAPDFMHFTRRENLPLIEKHQKLCANTPEGAKTGCSIGTQAVYAYNLDLIKLTQAWYTLPSGVISETDKFCCLLFNSDPSIWIYHPEECTTRYCREIDCRVDCRLTVYEVITVEQAFELANTNITGVCQEKFRGLDYDLERFADYYGKPAVQYIKNLVLT